MIEQLKHPHDPLRRPSTQASLEVVKAVEALLFSADRPLDERTLLELLDDAVGPDELDDALTCLADRYSPRHSGICLTIVAGGYQLRTAPEMGDVVARLRRSRPVRLSRAALETLAIVAYQQPVSRSEVEALRGVDSSGVLRSLQDLGLVRVVGRRDSAGRPLVYGTDQEFLSFFGLDTLEALPELRDADEIEPMALLRGDTN